MYKIFCFAYLMLTMITAIAQKESYDVVKYTAVKNAKKETADGYVSFTLTDNTKGGYCRIVIYKSAEGSTDSKINFDNDWQQFIQPLGAGNAQMQPVTTENGWELQNGTAQFNGNGLSGAAMLVTATAGNKFVSMVIMFNSDAYIEIITSFIGSVELQKPTASPGTTLQQNSNANSNSVVGIWVTNVAETRGFVNGHLMYTGGYTRKEYQIKDDGTYIFRVKNWLVNNETIYFAYEYGTWAMENNKLTITPKNGNAGWWNKDKITNDVNKWGNYQKAADYKIQTATYTLEIKTDSYYGNSIILNCSKATERDGGQFNQPPYRFAYVQRKETLIDNPPGFKTGGENIAPASASSNKISNTAVVGLWINNQLETSGYSNGMPQYSGGYLRSEYLLRENGTYVYRVKNWMVYGAKDILFVYETGTYAVTGNQITITPKESKGGWWKKTASTKEWGPFVKSSASGALESKTYTFEIKYYSGSDNTALIFKTGNSTGVQEYSYKKQDINGSLIDNPPGFIAK